MEGSGEMHSEDDRSLSNKKRIVKTRAQIKALEDFYEEHKYPTETMKLDISKEIGLTEKQVSSWFCHRRLKDKRISQGEPRQDRSSGVIQDLGSGLRQDSCGSTKQGAEKINEPREVESKRLIPHEVSNPDLTYERPLTRMDDTSSGSNSSLRNMYFKKDQMDNKASSRYGTQNFSNNNGGKPRTGPSGYLKLKSRPENPAITSVKRQLGRNYIEDGPPLGIHFDPLPPGAFESTVQDQDPDPDPVTEPYFEEQVHRHSSENQSKVYKVEEHDLPHSLDVSKIRKSGKDYGYVSKMGSHKNKSDLDGKKFKTFDELNHSENVFRQKSEAKIPMNKHRSIDMHEGSASETAISDSRVKYEMRAINGGGSGGGGGGGGGFRTDITVGHHILQPQGNSKRGRNWLTNNNEPKARKVSSQGDSFLSNPSDLTIKTSKKVEKVDKLYRARSIMDEDQVNVIPKNQRRGNVEFSEHEYMVKPSQEKMSQWTNHQIIRPVAEMRSSFSEEEDDDDDDDDDETADTDSSMS